MRTPEEQIRYAASITPSPRQLAWQQLEFYAFTHFGMNTFTNREWGDGTEDPALFNPDALDADQWVAAVKSAGMKALILTCKHHDGFCLWPSAYTEHSVKNSPWKNGQGDVVREVSDACRRGGIKFGVYLSPWDRHDVRYGQGKPYDDYFVSQLTELATNYGDIFCFWFDGACGEGKNGKKQIYDWERYYAVLRKLQPNAVLNVCELTASKSQQADDGEFSRKIDSQDEDIGSRAVIRNARELVWYPSEVDTSIRTGWFYHPEEDTDVRTAGELLDIYLDAVGANASLLLKAKITADSAIAQHPITQAVDGMANTYWQAAYGQESDTITLKFPKPQKVSCVVLGEHLSTGQRIESGEIWADGSKVAEFTVVGHKRICRFTPVDVQTLTIKITASRTEPTLRLLEVYQ